MDFGTMLEIRRVTMLPDGRSLVQTLGVSRFRVLERGTLDGYAVGRIERWVSPSLGLCSLGSCLGYSIDDFPEELEDTLDAALQEKAALEAENQTAAAPTTLATSPPSPSAATPLTQLPAIPLDAINEVLMDKCRTFVERLRDGAAPWIVQRLNDSYGNMPTDAPSFSFWVALVRFIARSVFRGRESRTFP